jgi:hypothetical protein
MYPCELGYICDEVGYDSDVSNDRCAKSTLQSPFVKILIEILLHSSSILVDLITRANRLKSMKKKKKKLQKKKLQFFV